MSALFHVDQSTADRWRADGRFVLFGGEVNAHELSRRNIGSADAPTWRTPVTWDGSWKPPAAMIEAAQACDTCTPHRPNSSVIDDCPDCSNGQRWHPVTVPCGTCEGDVRRTLPAWADDGCPDCTNGRISTGLLAVVEFGPLVVVEALMTAPPSTDAIEVTSGGGVVLRRCTDHGSWRSWTYEILTAAPPDVDPASLVGQWAIGGRIEVAS